MCAAHFSEGAKRSERDAKSNIIMFTDGHSVLNDARGNLRTALKDSQHYEQLLTCRAGRWH